MSHRTNFRRLAGLSDERTLTVARLGERTVTAGDLARLDERAAFSVGTRRQWKRGEHLKTIKGWKRLKKSERTPPKSDPEPTSVNAPFERMKSSAAKIAAATAKSALLGNLTAMGSFMGGNGEGMSKQPGFKYGSSYEAVATEGTPMKSRKMPAAFKAEVMDDIEQTDPQMKQCYFNAQTLALRNPERYTYVDGYVNAGFGFPIQHGWCVARDDDGEQYIVDPTLRHDQSKGATENNLTIGEIPEGHEYVGKEFPREMVSDRWKTGMAGSLYDWPPYYPLMRSEPDWAVAKKTKAVDFGD